MEIIKRLNRELVYKGTVINMYRDTVQVQNGHIAEWDFIGHKGAAAVVPVLDDGRVLMVKQYRNALDRMTIEVPAGGRDTTDEPYITCASRELEEETGLKGVKGVQLGSYGDYDRDPRTRIITTAYVFVEEEGKLTATAGDDAAAAGWFSMKVHRAGEAADSTQQIEKEFYDIEFECGDIRPAARVLVITDRTGILEKKDYKIVSSQLIAADHAAIILNGYDYVSEHIH